MDDELSIDSITNEKVPSQTSKEMAPKTSDKLAQKRQHFKIDWRKLTHFRKEASFLSKTVGAQQSSLAGGAGSPAAAPSQEQRRKILNSLDGCFRSGELSAILGPSGAGKTTFLSALFGNKQETSFGETRVTWYSDAQHRLVASAGAGDKLRRRPLRIAVLPQQDHLLKHLSVYETLLFASKIKNPDAAEKGGRNFHRQNVRRVAKMLKLNDCLDTRCAKLSGGQYKRVSIGQELLSEPDVIILDEPTSGLDATTCLTTVRTLKSIASKHPISIILTIHQPDNDVFSLFDRVYVIAQGGTAIFEGRPDEIVPRLAQVGLKLPSESYNPAKFIVENAFVPEVFGGAPQSEHCDECNEAAAITSEEEEDEEDDDDIEKPAESFLRRSVLSLTEAISGKESPSSLTRKARGSGRKPLLQIAIQTSDGKLVTSEQLNEQTKTRKSCKCNRTTERRLDLIRRLNELQKAVYVAEADGDEDSTSSIGDGALDSSSCHELESSLSSEEPKTSFCLSPPPTGSFRPSSLRSSCSVSPSRSANKAAEEEEAEEDSLTLSLSTDRQSSAATGSDVTPTTTASSSKLTGCKPPQPQKKKKKVAQVLERKFDKQLSAKYSNSKSKNYPTVYHTLLLAHRTWLSILRDPVFFGIQFCMHTTIPILLALIFGSKQEEACPKVGSFDLVKFAYGNEADDSMILATVNSIRASIGNIGVVFFEMFVLSFAINCITALVFPLDMHVLLKEYRNGWYSLRSYFFGRTLADLPVPVALHSVAMALLYLLTGQPISLLRFGGLLIIVILASLIAQSIGLTVGAVLMKSSQSSVLAAAGLIAPFFALSGFIVRIQTLPVFAKFAAQTSYLYHMLNGFIVLRYGFGRCDCSPEDFEQNSEHQIPQNLQTMASIWIGTYSNEFAEQATQLAAPATANANKTNVDPNIDVVEKMLNAFKLANSYGHKIETCDDVLPYAMLEFNLRDNDIYVSLAALLVMLLISRVITFYAIYYKVRSFA